MEKIETAKDELEKIAEISEDGFVTYGRKAVKARRRAGLLHSRYQSPNATLLATRSKKRCLTTQIAATKETGGERKGNKLKSVLGNCGIRTYVLCILVSEKRYF